MTPVTRLRDALPSLGGEGRVALLILVAITLAAIFGPLIVQWDPNAVAPLQKLRPPSSEHLLGTDEVGRDVLARLLAGARVSLVVGVLATAAGAATGAFIGVLSGWLGGWGDETIMRLVDILIAFPAIILAMAVIAILGPGIPNLVLVLAVVQVPVFARLARSSTLGELGREYVLAARSVGGSTGWILRRHIVPNIAPPLLAMAGLMIAATILNEAALGFLGLGVAPPQATWGNMMATGTLFVLVGAWWLTIFPGLAIFTTVLCFNILADSLRDALDPRRRLARVQVPEPGIPAGLPADV